MVSIPLENLDETLGGSLYHKFLGAASLWQRDVPGKLRLQEVMGGKVPSSLFALWVAVFFSLVARVIKRQREDLGL